MARTRLDKPLEWYPWNPLHWQASRRVQRMEWAARGFYRELMDECYLKGGIPDSVEGIAGLMDCDPDEITDLWRQVARCFNPHPTEVQKLVSPFIEEIRAGQLEARLKQSDRRKGIKGEVVDQDAGAGSCTQEITTDHRTPPKHTTVYHGPPDSTTAHREAPEHSSTGEERREEESTFLPPSEAGGGGAKPSRKAPPAAALAPAWMLAELKILGIVGTQAKSLVGKLGVAPLQAALAKVRAKKPEKSAAGLLVRKGAELAEEGSAILQAHLERALKLAPTALKDPKWTILPESLRSDLEIQTAWCVWKSTDERAKSASEDLRPDANAVERLAWSALLDLLEGRHPDPSGFKVRMEQLLVAVPKSFNPAMAKRMAFWKAMDESEGRAPCSSGSS